MPPSNHNRFAFVNRKRLAVAATIDDMESRNLLAKNLAAMMARSPDLATQGALHRKSKVAQSTIDRILGGETAATIDTLDQLAAAFGLSAWQLIHPHPAVTKEEAAFYAKLRKVFGEANGTK